MKRLFAVFTFAAALCSAQQCSTSQTKGGITQSVIGDATHTVVSVASITPAEELVFRVNLTPTANAAGIILPQSQLVVRGIGDGKNGNAVLVIFDLPLAQCVSVTISEYQIKEIQIFGN